MEIDICNAALTKNRVLDRLTSLDGTIEQINEHTLAADLCRQFYQSARRQVYRLAPWTCIQRRIRLADREVQRNTPYSSQEQVIANHQVGQQIHPAIWRAIQLGTTAPAAPIFPAQGQVVDGGVTWRFIADLRAGEVEGNLTALAHAYPVPDDYINQVTVTDMSGERVHFALEGLYIYTDAENPVLVYTPDTRDTALWDGLLEEAITLQLAGSIAYGLTGSHENEQAFMQTAAFIAEGATQKTMREKRQGRLPSAEWMPGLFPDISHGRQA